LNGKIPMVKERNQSLKKVFEGFVTYQRAMNRADKTISSYESCYKLFAEFYGEDNLCSDITEQTIIDYLIYLKDNHSHLSSKSVETYLRGLRAIIYYFAKNHYVEPFHIALPKAEKPIKETYTAGEMQRLIAKPTLQASCSFSQLRDWAMVCFLLATGVRLSSLINIKIEDLFFESQEIIIRKTKNRKQQPLPMSFELEAVLREYLQYRQGAGEEVLFCNAYGKPLTEDSMKTLVCKYNRSRGVEKTSIHLFRHTFAKNYIMNGGDPHSLKRLLGHSTLTMVDEYVQLYGGDLKRSYDKYNVFDQVRQAEEEAKGERILMLKKKK